MQFSPDGSKIAFASDRAGSLEIWVCNADGNHARQITQTGYHAGSPRWSPDGRWIAFDARVNGNSDIFAIPSEGGATRRMTTHVAEDNIPSWSRDGRWIYFSSNRTGRFEIWKAAWQGGPELQVTRNGGFAAIESSDGKKVYFARQRFDTEIWSTEPEQPVRLRDGGTLKTVHWNGWAVDEDGIYYLERDAGEKFHLTFAGFRDGIPKPLFSLAAAPNLGGGGLSLSPDRKSILYTQMDRFDSDIMMLEKFR